MALTQQKLMKIVMVCTNSRIPLNIFTQNFVVRPIVTELV